MSEKRLFKFKGIDELEGKRDGEYCFVGEGFGTDHFKKEKDLLDYITDNIEKFCNEILEDTLINFEADKSVSPVRGFGLRVRRCDLYVKCEGKTYIIELKNPFHKAENISAIGQILDYGREFTDPKKELIIITTLFDLNTAKTIKHYNLPIRYIYMDRERTLQDYRMIDG